MQESGPFLGSQIQYSLKSNIYFSLQSSLIYVLEIKFSISRNLYSLSKNETIYLVQHLLNFPDSKYLISSLFATFRNNLLKKMSLFIGIAAFSVPLYWISKLEIIYSKLNVIIL